MKNTNDYLTTTQIAKIVDYSESYVYNLIKTLKFSPEVTIKETNYYAPSIIDMISKTIETKNEQIDKYYPIYIRETFLIFESKINLQI
jgi:predicted DNA-binding transcriptional regulator AlpA